MSLFTEAVDSLSKLYGLEADEAKLRLTELGDKFNLKKAGSIDEDSLVWGQIAKALSDRNDHASKAIASIDKLLSHTHITPALTEKMQQLQKEFIALFSAHKIDGACYHFYGHGVEMSQDPGDFLVTLLPKGSTIHPLIHAITNALGAAHDIIQGKRPPTNERESAAIFIKITQDMIDNMIGDRSGFKEEELNALEDFRDYGIPFLAEECIVNATYLLFNSGKRDFDNVLLLTEKALSPDARHHLDPLTAAMKMSMALADTRRSEMKHVLIKFEVLRNIPPTQFADLECLLQGIHLIERDQTIEKLLAINNQEKLMQIEGFLLRMGQNIRMTAELDANKGRVNLIKDIRANMPVVFSLENHLEPFLRSITGAYGEAAFAQALGEIDRNELRQNAEFYGLTLNAENFDFLGWEQHSRDLENSRQFLELEAVPEETKQLITQMLYTVAAKSPGHRVPKETYETMKFIESQLVDETLRANLHEETEEIRRANPDIALKAPAELGLFKGRPSGAAEEKMSPLPLGPTGTGAG